MLPLPAQTIDDVLPLLTHDIIDAIATRPQETAADNQRRAETALRMLEAFEARDAVEVMFAGQALMFHALMLDATRDACRAEDGPMAQRHRQSAVALSRVQLSWFRELRLHRAARSPEAVEAALPPPAVEPAPPPAPVAAKPADQMAAEPAAQAGVPPRRETGLALPEGEPKTASVPAPPPHETPRPLGRDSLTNKNDLTAERTARHEDARGIASPRAG